MICGRWREHEDEFLRANVFDMTTAEIAHELDRSVQSVANRKVELRLRRYGDESYHGCDEDCFHCRYSDCRKPL